ncbi:MAG TPA: hypothetical protein VLH94_02145 [Spirochaetia bacterium]|nr:hypothetical protein [Spirochaetia bacterium]
MSDCVFCDPAKISERTIATIRNINIVATLGQITEGGYTLLIPTEHSSCLGACDKNTIQSIDSLSRLVSSVLIAEYRKGVTIFEHGIVGQTIKHSHLHLLPTKINLTKRIFLDFPKSEIQIVKDLSELQSAYQTRQEPYLLWSVPDNLYAVRWNPPAPSQYFRTVCAELLGVPERADWKTIPPEKDEILIKETIRRLTPFFNF